MPLAENPQSEPVVFPRWGDFNLAMLQNPAYQRVSSQSSMQRSVSRLESYFATQVDNWPVAVLFWQQMLTGCPVEKRPTTSEAAAWTVIAQQTNMPIRFNEQGYLEIDAR